MKQTMTSADYEKLEKARKSSPDFMKADVKSEKGSIFNYILAKAGKDTLAIDDDYVKTEIMPIDYLKRAERLDSGLYLLKNQIRTKYDIGTIDHMLLPVYLAGLAGVEEDIDPEKAHYMLIKRSATGIPQFIADEETGEKKELNFSLALITGERPDFRDFYEKEIVRTQAEITPAIIKDGKNLIPILNLEAAFRDFTQRFCRLYPELSRYYPFSRDFMYNGGRGKL